MFGAEENETMTPKQKQYYDMEASRQGALIHHALQLLYDQKLDTPTRRALGVSAKRYLVDHHLKAGRLPDHDPRVEDLIRVALAGLARAEDAIAILVGYAKVIDAESLENACQNAGTIYRYFFALADRWWGMTTHPTGWRCTGQEQQKKYRPQAIKAYKQNPTFETAQTVVRAYLSLPEFIHLTRLGIKPGTDQAYEAYSRASGYGTKACADYIQSITH